MKQKLLKIIGHYGKESQEMQAIEEMSELTQAISKHRRKGTEETKENLLEEIADVYVMLEQMLLIYNIDSSHVRLIVNNKIDRQLERIAKEQRNG